jgi:hypothetical protein
MIEPQTKAAAAQTSGQSAFFSSVGESVRETFSERRVEGGPVAAAPTFMDRQVFSAQRDVELSTACGRRSRAAAGPEPGKIVLRPEDQENLLLRDTNKRTSKPEAKPTEAEM